MLDNKIKDLLHFLNINLNNESLDSIGKTMIKSFYDEINKITKEIPSVEKIEELQNIEIELETKYECLYELGNYFDPVFIHLKNIIHKNNVKKLREKNILKKHLS